MVLRERSFEPSFTKRSSSQGLLNLPFDGVDVFRDRDFLRARSRAFEVIHASPSPIGIIRLFEAFQALVVARIEDEPKGPNQRGRSEKLFLLIYHRTRGHATGTEDTPDGHIDFLAFLGGLSSLLVWRIPGGNQVGSDQTDLFKKRLKVHDEVFDYPEGGKGLQDHVGALVLFGQLLAGQGAAPVDPHGIGATHAVAAGHSITERPVLVPFYSVKAIQDTFRGIGTYFKLLKARLLVSFRIESIDFELKIHDQYTLGFGSNLVMVGGL